jgi:hypothetical protein
VAQIESVRILMFLGHPIVRAGCRNQQIFVSSEISEVTCVGKDKSATPVSDAEMAL